MFGQRGLCVHELLCDRGRWTTWLERCQACQAWNAAGEWQAHYAVQSRLPGSNRAHPAMPCACTSFQLCTDLPA